MPTPQPKSKQKNPNKVDLLKAIDRSPTKQTQQNAMGQAGPGMAPGQGMTPAPGMGAPPPPAFPYPAHQLDRSAPGVPNLTDMMLHSFRPQPPPSMAPPVGAPPPQAQGGAPPMAAQGQGPKPARRMG